MKPTMTLILDSSTPTLFLGLLREGVVLGHLVETLDRKHAEWMLPRILGFINKFNLKLSDITDVIVGHGPGSFTGVRLALTLIKTWALIQPLRVFPISTMQLFAYEPDVIMSLDARGERRYVGVYQGTQMLMSPRVVTDKDFPSLQLQFPTFTSITIEAALHQPILVLQHIKALASVLKPLLDIQTLNPLYLKELL